MSRRSPRPDEDRHVEWAQAQLASGEALEAAGGDLDGLLAVLADDVT
jgi:hypothetical protein